MSRLTVLINDPADLDVAAVGRILAPLQERHFNDVCRDIRFGAGILLQDAPEEEARRFLQELEKAGIGAHAIETERFPPLAPLHRVTEVEVQADQLTVGVGYGRNQHDIPWNRIRWIHLHGMERDAVGHELKETSQFVDPRTRTISDRCEAIIEGLNLYLEKRRDRVLDLVLDLYCFEPFAIYRFKMGDFGFAYLGDRKKSHSVDNWLLFGREVLQRAQTAEITDETRHFFAESEPPSDTVLSEGERMAKRFEQISFDQPLRRENFLRYQQYRLLKAGWNLDEKSSDTIRESFAPKETTRGPEVTYDCPKCEVTVTPDLGGRCPQCGIVLVGRKDQAGELGFEAILYAVLIALAIICSIAAWMAQDLTPLMGWIPIVAILIFHYLRSKY